MSRASVPRRAVLPTCGATRVGAPHQLFRRNPSRSMSRASRGDAHHARSVCASYPSPYAGMPGHRRRPAPPTGASAVSGPCDTAAPGHKPTQTMQAHRKYPPGPHTAAAHGAHSARATASAAFAVRAPASEAQVPAQVLPLPSSPWASVHLLPCGHVEGCGRTVARGGLAEPTPTTWWRYTGESEEERPLPPPSSSHVTRRTRRTATPFVPRQPPPA